MLFPEGGASHERAGGILLPRNTSPAARSAGHAQLISPSPPAGCSPLDPAGQLAKGQSWLQLPCFPHSTATPGQPTPRIARHLAAPLPAERWRPALRLPTPAGDLLGPEGPQGRMSGDACPFPRPPAPSHAPSHCFSQLQGDMRQAQKRSRKVSGGVLGKPLCAAPEK